MNMGERMLGLRRQRLNNSWDVCTALLRGWLRVWRSIAPQRCSAARFLKSWPSLEPWRPQIHPPTRITVNGHIRGTIGRYCTRGPPSASSAGTTATWTGLTYLYELVPELLRHRREIINQHKLTRRDSPASQRSPRSFSRPRGASRLEPTRELKEAPPNHESPKPASTTRTSGTSPGYARRTRS